LVIFVLEDCATAALRAIDVGGANRRGRWKTVEFAKTSTKAGLALPYPERWMGMTSKPRRMLAIVAGVAAILLTGIATPVWAQAAADMRPVDGAVLEQTASLNPGHALPNIQFGPIGLSEADSDAYRQVFALQEQADWAHADSLIAKITDRRLMGHVLYQRYMHPTGWTSRYGELVAWMESYADQPGAQNIYSLAMKRRPSGAAAPKPPVVPARLGEGNVENFGFAPPPVQKWAAMSGEALRRSRSHVAKLRDLIRRDQLTRATDYIAAHVGEIDPLDKDTLFGQMAAAYFRLSMDPQALKVAQQVQAGAAEMAPQALWYGGLAAWRLAKYDAAYPLFNALANSAWASPWDRAAGAYWAARTALKVRKPQMVSAHLRDAARYPHTFYGIVATRRLGLDGDFRWEAPKLTRGHLAIIARTPAAYRAVGLLQVGQSAIAEQELQRVDPKGDYLVTEALVALAEAGRLPRLSLALASNFLTEDGGTFDQALFPLPSWSPPGGFRTDPALVYAFIRQESRFASKARSSAGARGLMQIMPATAAYVVKHGGLPASVLQNLDDPINSVMLGDAYLQHLMEQPIVGANLIKLAAAYNGGPGNLAKWEKRIGADDPLLFIEMIPMAETREHIERVMAFYWLYRLRLGQVPHSLDDVVRGDWPLFRSQEAREMMYLQSASMRQ
jgi:soluble lytic murein transglycosylase